MESFLCMSARGNIRCTKWILILLLISTTPLDTVEGLLDGDKSDQPTDFSINLLRDKSGPIIRGDEVAILSRFTLAHSGRPEITWYMGDRAIHADQSDVFDIIVNRTTVSTSVGQRYTYTSVLKMTEFKRNLLDSYSCKITEPHQTAAMTVGTVFIKEDMFAEPEVLLRPTMLVVQRNTIETICCYYKEVERIVIVDGDKPILTKDVNFSNQTFNVVHTFTPALPSTLRCKGYLKGRVVMSNDISVTTASKGDKICPQNIDNHGTNWTAAKAPSVIQGDCPEGYTGFATRKCKYDGTWEKAVHVNCTRNDFGDMMESIKLLQGLAPSAEDVENVASNLSQSMSRSKAMSSTDVMQTVDMMDEINTMAGNDSGKVMVTTSVVMMVASVTNHLLDEMDAMEEAEDMADEFSQMKSVMGARLLVAVDKLVTASLRESHFSSRPIVMKNIVIKRDKLDSPRDVRFPDEKDRASEDFKDWMDENIEEVFLPSSVFPPDLGTVSYSATLLRRNKFLTSAQNITFNHRWVQSNALAFSTNKVVDFESSQIEITFGIPKEGYIDPMCSFLDTSAREMGVWSMRGCQTQEAYRPGVANCRCNHLTNFAVLMSPSFGAESSHAEALSIISIIGCIISIACLLALLVTYAILWKYLKKDRKIRLHLTLGICLLMAYVIFLAGVERSPHEPDCTFITAILHYLLLVVFFIMLCEGVEILMAVLYVFTSSFSVWKLLVPSFVIPALIVIITYCATQAEGYRSDDVCWLSWSSGTIWAFIGPSLAVILLNYVVLAITLRVILTSASMKKSGNVDKVKTAIKSVALLSPVLGLTWFFGVLSVNEDTVVFQYLFTICNSLQGLTIFVVYCLMSHQVKDAYATFRRKQKAKSLSLASGSTYGGSARKFSSDPTDTTVTKLSKLASSTSSHKIDSKKRRKQSLNRTCKDDVAQSPSSSPAPRKATGSQGGRLGILRSADEGRKTSVSSTAPLEEYRSSSPVSNGHFDSSYVDDNATDSGMEESNNSVFGNEHDNSSCQGSTHTTPSDLHLYVGSASPVQGRLKW